MGYYIGRMYIPTGHLVCRGRFQPLRVCLKFIQVKFLDSTRIQKPFFFPGDFTLMSRPGKKKGTIEFT